MNRLRILLADDTPDIRDLVRITLEMDGRFEVVGEAEDGSQAVKLAEIYQPAAVLLDLAMPVMDGLQAIPLIKTISPQSKVAILSGFSASRMASIAKASGADAYFEKGSDIQDLADLLAELCGLDRKETASIAMELDSTKGVNHELQLLSLITHEIQTPLTVIQGFAATLAESVQRMNQSTIRQSSEAIQKHAAKLADLIKSFEAADDLERGRMSLHKTECDLGGLVYETVADLKEIYEPRSVSMDVRTHIRTCVDGIRIRQVLTNLITNAAKFSPADSVIEVSVERINHHASVTVRDFGAGVPSERESELFQRFSRLDSTAKGTGLGLFLSRGIARAHGGEVRFVRPEDSVGSKFLLELPL